MAYWNRQDTYTTDKAIIAFPDGQASPYSTTLYASDVGLTTENKQVVPAGLFVSQTNNAARFLARSYVQTKAGAGTTIVVDHAELFKPGDTYYVYLLTDEASLTPGFTPVATGNIVGVNYATGTITTSASVPAVTAGVHGFGVIPGEVLGIYPHSIDFTDAPSVIVGVINKAHGVYKNALPYYDAALEALFGLHLNIRSKF